MSSHLPTIRILTGSLEHNSSIIFEEGQFNDSRHKVNAFVTAGILSRDDLSDKARGGCILLKAKITRLVEGKEQTLVGTVLIDKKNFHHVFNTKEEQRFIASIEQTSEAQNAEPPDELGETEHHVRPARLSQIYESEVPSQKKQPMNDEYNAISSNPNLISDTITNVTIYLKKMKLGKDVNLKKEFAQIELYLTAFWNLFKPDGMPSLLKEQFKAFSKVFLDCKEFIDQGLMIEDASKTELKNLWETVHETVDQYLLGITQLNREMASHFEKFAYATEPIDDLPTLQKNHEPVLNQLNEKQFVIFQDSRNNNMFVFIKKDGKLVLFPFHIDHEKGGYLLAHSSNTRCNSISKLTKLIGRNRGVT